MTRDPFGCVKHHPFDWQYKMFPEGKWKCKLYSAKWKKNVCTLLKDLLHIPIYPFCGRDGAFAPPPPFPRRMDAPLNYPFSILCSGKALKDLIDLCQGCYITELRDWPCFSIHSNVFKVHVQRANCSYWACERISPCSIICWTC